MAGVIELVAGWWSSVRVRTIETCLIEHKIRLKLMTNVIVLVAGGGVL